MKRLFRTTVFLATAVLMILAVPSVAATEGLDVAMACDISGLLTGGLIVCGATVRGGVAPYSFDWDMGDGTRASGESVSHTYRDSGSHSITVFVTDFVGQTGSSTGIHDGGAVPLSINAFCSPVVVVVGIPVSCSAVVSAGVPPYTLPAWDFGDGSPMINASSVIYTYAVPGPGQTTTPYCPVTGYWYHLIVSARDSIGQVANAFPCVEVRPLSPVPEALEINMSCDISGVATGGPIACSATTRGGTPPYSFAWDMGDGTRATGEQVSHDYEGSGFFVITVIGVDILGQTGSSTGGAFLAINAPTPVTVGAFCSPQTVTVGTPISCSATAYGGTPPYALAEWSFGDGSPIVLASSVIYTYKIPGPGGSGCGTFGYDYGIVVTVEDSMGSGGLANLCVTVLPLIAVIDVKPADSDNTVRLTSRGLLPVAILTRVDPFDATRVDPSTVRFGKSGTEASPVRFALEDVNLDGHLDMVLFFDTQEAGFQPGDTEAVLTGKTLSGLGFEGTDYVRAL